MTMTMMTVIMLLFLMVRELALPQPCFGSSVGRGCALKGSGV